MPNFDYIRLEMRNLLYGTVYSDWANFTPNMLNAYSWSRCNMGNSLTDKVMKKGTFTFQLNNSDKTYTQSGWWRRYVGGEVRLVYCYDGIDYVKWQGRIKKMQPSAGEYADRRVTMYCEDMVGELDTTIELPSIATSKNMNEVIQLILENTGVEFDNIEYGTTSKTFSSVFDTVKQTTPAIQEITKVAISEFAHVMFRMDRANGRTLMTQNLTDRDDADVLTVPIASDVGSVLELTNGNTLELTNGNELLLRQQEYAKLWNTFTDLKTSVEWPINKVRITTNPRTYDSTYQVLAQIDTPILLDQAGGPKDSTTIRIAYTDPDDKASQITALDMQTPVATTDYTSNTQEDGGGTDRTANLTVTAVFGTNEVEFTITNTHTADVYVTKLQARGIGIYIYSPLDVVYQKTGTYTNFIGDSETSFNLKYFSEYGDAEDLAESIAKKNYYLYYKHDEVTYIANRSSSQMMTFLFAEPGDFISVQDSQTGTNLESFIQAIKVQGDGDFVTVTYKLKPKETNED